MRGFIDELNLMRSELERMYREYEESGLSTDIEKLEKAVSEVADSFGGSWLGYHSRVYYKDFDKPPTGAHFSGEWGPIRTLVGSTVGDWEEMEFEAVREHVFDLAGIPDLERFGDPAIRSKELFRKSQREMLSLLSVLNDVDPYFGQQREEVEAIKVYGFEQVLKRYKPRQAISRDQRATDGGFQTPPHVSVLVQAQSIRTHFSVCRQLLEVVEVVASHLKRRERLNASNTDKPTRVFIGHGRSSQWRELKDFLAERLHLSWDEFNRVPVAGFHTAERLQQMLDSSTFAFLVLTGEDEQLDSSRQARMNVVHEAGLFQGRLGFTKAILLLEDGCAEFSNIHGLSQIRFPVDRISAAFEEVRRVLEREKVIPS